MPAIEAASRPISKKLAEKEETINGRQEGFRIIG